jgi:hypothetical protein
LWDFGKSKGLAKRGKCVQSAGFQLKSVCQQLGEISWQFGLKSHQPAGSGMFEGNRFGMKR